MNPKMEPVAVVNDMRDGVAYPLGRLIGAEFIQHQDSGFQHGPQHFQFRSLGNGIPACLNVPQKVAEIVEKPAVAVLGNHLLQQRDGKMRFPDPARPQKKQAAVNARIFVQESLHQCFGPFLRFVGRIIGIQSTVFISLRYPCLGDKTVNAR